jgi:uncharacterized protein
VSPALEAGRAAFNRGEFFEAHERWEDVWRLLAGPERTFVQGLIQIAAGLHHLQGGRLAPAARLLRKGLAKLSGPAASGDLPVAALAQQVGGLIARLDPPAAGPPPDARGIKL